MFRNRRQVAGAPGLTPTTQASGDAERELGINKAGNAIMRALTIEFA
jgi:transposase